MNKRACIYTRISVAPTTQSEGESLKSQYHRCYKRLQEYGLHEPKPLHFEDNGYSGASLDRPGMTALLAMVECKQVSKVVVTELSRLTRNPVHFHSLRTSFIEHDVELVMLDFNQDPKFSYGSIIF